MTCRISHFQDGRSFQLNPLVSLLVDSYAGMNYTNKKIYIYIRNFESLYNIKIRPLMTEYALMIKLVGGTSSAHSFNPYAYLSHS